MSNTVTLGITYYNERGLLTECLESLYKCEQLPDEVIVYDDFSRYPAEDYVISDGRCRLRVIRGARNIMLAAARNQIMEAACSTYIRYQDADDLFDPLSFSRLIEFVRVTRHPLVLNDVQSIEFESGQPICASVMGLSGICGRAELLRHGIMGSLLSPSVTFDVALGRDLGGYDSENLRQCEDFEFNLRLVYAASSYELFSESAVVQRVRPGSMSSNRSELLEEALKALERLAEVMPDQKEFLGQRAFKVARELATGSTPGLAQRAFDMAFNWSRRPYVQESTPYRFGVSLLGVRATERLARWKRRHMHTVVDGG